MSQILSEVSKANPYATAAVQGIKTIKAIDTELLGYDFFGLGTKLIVYFTFAFLIAKFMEFVVGAGGFISNLLNFFGIKWAGTVPQWASDFWTNGFQGIRYWDVIKSIAILLVGWEAIRYWQSNERLGGKASPMTLGIFTVILSLLSLTTIPELVQHIKDFQAMQVQIQ